MNRHALVKVFATALAPVLVGVLPLAAQDLTNMIQIMGPNTASYVQMGDQLGTIETGKIADIILLDGDPLESDWNWLKTTVTIKGGVIVVDKR
jgi:predicted amidohydrolase YtcJ